MESCEILYEICKQLDLGFLTEPPLKLQGGYMHKMFRIKTIKGDFAVKLLNPMIMKRPEAFNNYKIAEALESKLQLAKIPIVPALEYFGSMMQCCNNQYYYVFNWIQGKALKAQEILEKHCVAIGSILAEIHNIETKVANMPVETFTIDWNHYIMLAQNEYPKIAQILDKNINILIASQEDGNIAKQQVNNIIAICHGDMDSKNVLWQDNNPMIIDLECLKWHNPYMELFELALCWAGYERSNIDYKLLEAFIRAYVDKRKNFEVDWKILYSCNNGRLQWLEYNLKRAIMIECAGEEEQKLGIQQFKETMEHIVYYHSIKDSLINKLSELFPYGNKH